MKHISIIIPVYNEAQSIRGVIERCQAIKLPDHQIIVVNDGSTDETASALMELGVVIITKTHNLGNGAALKAGIRASSGDVLVFLDGDGQHNPEDIPKLLKHLDNYDMVVGWRKDRSTGSWWRNCANWLYNRLASHLVLYKIEDLTSGFRVMTGEVARRFRGRLPDRFSSPTTLTILAIKAGYRIKYVPITVNRRVGKSKIRLLRDGMRFLTIIVKLTVLTRKEK